MTVHTAVATPDPEEPRGWPLPSTSQTNTFTFTTKDSGAREEFETGSVRDTEEGKGRYDLLPREAIHRLAGLYERGAAKYGDRNWEKGQQYSRMFSSLLRHAFQAKEGMTDEDHLAAVAWNAFALITTMERVARGELPASLNDMPWAEGEEAA